MRNGEWRNARRANAVGTKCCREPPGERERQRYAGRQKQRHRARLGHLKCDVINAVLAGKRTSHTPPVRLGIELLRVSSRSTQHMHWSMQVPYPLTQSQAYSVLPRKHAADIGQVATYTQDQNRLSEARTGQRWCKLVRRSMLRVRSLRGSLRPASRESARGLLSAFRQVSGEG